MQAKIIQKVEAIPVKVVLQVQKLLVKVITEITQENLPEKKDVFFLYTCARTSNRFTRTIREEATRKNATVLGEYGCRGFNTYGPWKLIGGMNKAHPTDEDIEDAVMFLKSLV